MRTIATLSSLLLFGLVAVAGCKSAPQTRGQAQCPEGRNSDEMFCARIPRYARDPDTGQCCRYETACAAPVGWKTYTSRDACERVGQHARQTADAGNPPANDAGAQASCPAPQQSQAMCAQVITWAKDPNTGACCQYATPCEAPTGWQTFSDQAACQKSGQP